MTDHPYTRFNAGTTPETMIEVAPHQFVTKAFYDRFYGKATKTRTHIPNDNKELPAGEAEQSGISNRRGQQKGET